MRLNQVCDVHVVAYAGPVWGGVVCTVNFKRPAQSHGRPNGKRDEVRLWLVALA